MRKFKSISLILLGLVLGLSISYAPKLEAAASKLLGSKVGNVLSVKLDDKSIGQGAVIDGTTYVPLRAAANELGMEVVKVDNKEVVLSSGSESAGNDIPKPNDKSAQIQNLNAQISELNKKIRNAEEILVNKERSEGAIEDMESMKEIIEKSWDLGSELYDKQTYDMYVEKADNLRKVLKDAETNLPTYKQQLESLKVELADLQK
ncbi:hypothetical protein [Paenibacillus bouchesdurhonensis]|uniref:hypothetical protein n=1 Tax=Paenibacillus bouchesdurhonensis TaxID=1870990 RepID=UPI0019028201|nr:hypothetical protein [Paenibacillus bouchesdurhonensis]